MQVLFGSYDNSWSVKLKTWLMTFKPNTKEIMLLWMAIKLFNEVNRNTLFIILRLFLWAKFKSLKVFMFRMYPFISSFYSRTFDWIYSIFHLACIFYYITWHKWYGIASTCAVCWHGKKCFTQRRNLFWGKDIT
jgi:hypothetical protein